MSYTETVVVSVTDDGQVRVGHPGVADWVILKPGEAYRIEWHSGIAAAGRRRTAAAAWEKEAADG